MPGAVLYPFAVSTLPWESLPGQWNLTVGLKATYILAPSPGEPALSSQTDGLHEDVLFDHSPHASLYSPSDFVPFKARADVLLVGQAHAPGGVPTDSVLVRLRLGDLSKTLRVTGDRAWVDTPQGPRPSAARPFTSAPLRYERASRKGENLAGNSPGDPSRPPAAIDLAPEEGPAETPGFGPIAASWRASRDPRLQDVLIWSQRLRTAPHQGPPPAGADPTLFNSAPRDQQPTDIPPGAPLVLDHLHPRFPRLEARLPTIVPRVFHLDAASGTPREVPVRIDTVWIDTDREVFVVSWRGFISTALRVEAGPGRVVVAAHPRGESATFDEINALVRGVARPKRWGRPRPQAFAMGEAPKAPPQAFAMGETPKPPPQAFAMGETPKPPPQAFAMGETPKPPPQAPTMGETPKPPPQAPPTPATRRAPPKTAALPVVIEAPAAPFSIAAPGATPAPNAAAPIAGAPWAGVPAVPVIRPSKHLGETIPSGPLPIPRMETPGEGRAKGKAPRTMAMPQVTGPAPAPAPFPLATPATSAAAAPSAPVEGPPWAGVPAAPVPRPNDLLMGTMPLGSSLADALAKAKGLAASTPAPPAVVAPPPVVTPAPAVVATLPAVTPAVPAEPPPAVAPRPPSVAPPPPPPVQAAPAAPSAQPVWRVDEPAAAPAPPARAAGASEAGTGREARDVRGLHAQEVGVRRDGSGGRRRGRGGVRASAQKGTHVPFSSHPSAGLDGRGVVYCDQRELVPFAPREMNPSPTRQEYVRGGPRGQVDSLGVTVGNDSEPASAIV